MNLRKSLAAVAAVAALATVSACGSDDSSDDAPVNNTTAASEQQNAESTPAVPEPSPEELGSLLQRASDPAVPTQEKLNTVQGGNEAPELFEVLTKMRADANAEIQPTGTVIPGSTPDTRNLAIDVIIPGQQPIQGNQVEFIYDQDAWKISTAAVCNFAQLLPPEQVPALCADGGAASDAPAPADPNAPAEQPEQPAN